MENEEKFEVVCAWCEKHRVERVKLGQVVVVWIKEKVTGENISHGICPACEAQYFS